MSSRRSTPPKIGGFEWDRELAALGVDRAVVDEELGWVLDGRSTAEVDPHSVYFDSVPAGVVAATWVLLHQEQPSYGTLMYLQFVWSDADEYLRAWIVRQFAAMLVHGPPPVAESAEYGLWVDYFETPSDAREVFPSLAGQLPHSHWPRLLSAAGPVPWTVKRTVFTEAAEVPALHAALAKGIAGSFYDVYGNVDAVEAARLLESIRVADDDLRSALTEATTQPLLLRSGAAILVDDPAWEHPGSFLLEATVSAGRQRWVPGSELVVDGTVYGKLRHWDFPFDESLAHRVVPVPPLHGDCLHRVEAPPEHAQVLANRDLEAWPSGLREHVMRNIDVDGDAEDTRQK
ncbi:hypothetical protein ACFOY2_35025 [Nonomuraea purpurea]|uniref:Uncharacterized protein n=1 Tax=Nonomuraea purpurea TaxID=1849276 RepID=A0ABV8GJZ9_9ACTN